MIRQIFSCSLIVLIAWILYNSFILQDRVHKLSLNRSNLSKRNTNVSATDQFTFEDNNTHRDMGQNILKVNKLEVAVLFKLHALVKVNLSFFLLFIYCNVGSHVEFNNIRMIVFEVVLII